MEALGLQFSQVLLYLKSPHSPQNKRGCHVHEVKSMVQYYFKNSDIFRKKSAVISNKYL